MAVPKAIIITAIPKYVHSDGTLSNQAGIKLKARNSILKCSNNTAIAGKIAIPKSNLVTSMGCEDSQISVPNRKRRLDHLTLEEKLQRKKLKNRVAAQSSRDRKKARLDDLETEVRILKEKNEALTLQCHNLQLEKKQLASENQELRQKLSGLECNHQTHDVGCSTQVEPAAFSMDPLPQGQALQRALGPGSQVLTMWQVLKYCLISQISSIVLMEICAYLTWMNWLKAYSEKPLKWTQSTDSPVQRLECMDSRERVTIIKWWGRHQKTWKPIEN
ncbi:X-box-binding protein 1 [Cryptotermes secundus]|uniref:X-box-binding protein 1 n=1 Tax=Cryptotermes secundus TaxID=105785 RepID=UPI000CD7CA31|nr:X-box-binding protein 1 [Cryptotermes secundus]